MYFVIHGASWKKYRQTFTLINVIHSRMSLTTYSRCNYEKVILFSDFFHRASFLQPFSPFFVHYNRSKVFFCETRFPRFLSLSISICSSADASRGIVASFVRAFAISNKRGRHSSRNVLGERVLRSPSPPEPGRY